MGGLRRQELQRYESVEPSVDSFVYDAHSTLAELGLDLIMQNPFAPPCRDEGADGSRLSRGSAVVAVVRKGLSIGPVGLQKCRVSCFSGKAHGKPSELR